ncbi:hypothetical protein B0H19DRAFT_1062558 [Mycena capillaripes]|nr:hypothetical protein B0H19DRAFT_1062558 [Mycena capillaripes]
MAKKGSHGMVFSGISRQQRGQFGRKVGHDHVQCQGGPGLGNVSHAAHKEKIDVYTKAAKMGSMQHVRILRVGVAISIETHSTSHQSERGSEKLENVRSPGEWLERATHQPLAVEPVAASKNCPGGNAVTYMFNVWDYGLKKLTYHTEFVAHFIWQHFFIHKETASRIED